MSPAAQAILVLGCRCCVVHCTLMKWRKKMEGKKTRICVWRRGKISPLAVTVAYLHKRCVLSFFIATPQKLRVCLIHVTETQQHEKEGK